MNNRFKLDIRKFQLDNGLKILALEDHFIPIVSYYTFYKVGSRNEIPGITGISHLFEHMMFKGSKKFKNVSFDKILEPMGGYSNAYTSKDMTVFYENFPPDVLSLVVELDSDRMSNLNLDTKELNSEREVVKEERRYRTDNSIIGKLDEELYLAGYNIHPYRFPIIGFISDLDNISVNDCYNYLKTYYNPSNSCIVIVGDFNFDVLLKLIEEHYGKIKSPRLKKQFITSEPEQSGEKRVEYHKPAEVYSFMIGFHVPDVFSPDVYTLEILQTILTDGESSLLQKKLIYEEQIALSIFSDFTWRIDPSYFVLYIQMKPNYTAEEGEKILYQVIEKVKNGDISDKEIVKAKNKIESNFIKSIKTTSGKGEKIGTFETLFSDYKLIFNILDEINKIEKDNLIKVANKYFTKNNRTVATLIPK
jgi:predicted Zn-dependent peptidase